MGGKAYPHENRVYQQQQYFYWVLLCLKQEGEHGVAGNCDEKEVSAHNSIVRYIANLIVIC